MTDILKPSDRAHTVAEPRVSPPVAPNRQKRSPRIPRLIKHVVLIVCGIVMLYPVIWMVISSLRSNDQIFNNPGLLLTDPQWNNYSNGWNALAHPFGHYMINSAIVVLGAVVGNLASCSLAAYAFARLQFRGKSWAFGAMLLTIMLPIHVVIVPQYIIFSQLGWTNTFIPLILPKLLATDCVLHLLDGAVHPRPAEIAGRGRSGGRLQPLPDLLEGSSCR